jgi:PEP-CTERM motif
MKDLMNFVTRGTTAICLAVGLASGAAAATLDFATPTYASTFGPNVATDSVAGVNFTITATARGVNGFRQSFDSSGLSFGVPGNGMYSISIVADQNLVFNSMYGKGHGFTPSPGQLPFDLTVAGGLVSSSLMFATNVLETVNFASGPVSVASGQAFKLDVDFGSLVGSSIFASALIKSLDFDLVGNSPSPVPLPAGLSLLLAGLGAFGFVGRKKKRA